MADQLPLPFLRCRTFGHAWEEYIPAGMRRPEFGFRFSLLCTSCGTERHELVNALGAVGQREYRYPPGYQLDFRLYRADARVEYERRRPRRNLSRRATA